MSAGVLARAVIAEGYLTEDHGDSVVFRVEGTRFAYELCPGDEGYARLTSCLRLPTGTRVAVALRRANEQNCELKAVKTSIGIHARTVTFSIEAFFGDPAHLALTVPRAVAAIGHAAEQFFAAS